MDKNKTTPTTDTLKSETSAAPAPKRGQASQDRAKAPSALLSPAALMALGLAGAAHAKTRPEDADTANLQPAQAPNVPVADVAIPVEAQATEAAPDDVAQEEIPAAEQGLAAGETTVSDIPALVAEAGALPDPLASDTVQMAVASIPDTLLSPAVVSDAGAGAPPADAPMLLAQAAPAATAAEGSTAATAAGSTAGGAAAGATTAAAVTTVSAGAVLAGIAGVALVGGGLGKGSSAAPGDTTAPTVSSVAISSATGAQNSKLNAGDVVSVTVTMSEATTVTGTPQLALNIGGTTVQANYASGSGTTALVFTYTVQASQTDANGISITANSLALNGGTLKDAAGNSATLTHSEVTDNASYLIDTTAPTLISAQKSTDGLSITMTFSESMDSAQLPSAGKFTLADGTDTTTYTVTGVAISTTDSSAVVLTLNQSITGKAISLDYTENDAADDTTNVLQDQAGHDLGSIFSGQVADGYVRGADIWVYAPTNPRADSTGWVDTGLKTNTNGDFFLPKLYKGMTIKAIGGVNIDTGVPNTMELKAPAGSTTINPLTTLVQAVVSSSTGITAADAAKTVASTLGITLGTGQTLLNYDPLAAAGQSGDVNAVNAQKAAAQVATMVVLAENSSDGAGAAIVASLAQQIKNASTDAQTLNLADANTVSSVINAVSALSSNTQVQSEMADASYAIGQSSSLAAIATAQSKALDDIKPSDPGLSTSKTTTNDSTPTIKVSFDVTSTDGTAANVGDTITLLIDGVPVGNPVVITTADFTAGYVNIDTPTLTEGSYSLTATITDKANNISAPAAALTVTIDQTAPATPTINTVAGDNVLNAGENSAGVNLTGTTEAGSSVSLGIGGNTRTATVTGSTWSYQLTASDISALGQGSGKTIAITATDAAGNQSQTTSQAFAVDTAVPTATAAITGATDDVTPTTGNVASGSSTATNDQTLGLTGTVTGTLGSGEVVAIYDTVSGVSTRMGTGTVSVSGNTTSWSLTTPNLGNGAHSLTARVEDAAGNQGTASTAYSVTVNADLPTATAGFTALPSLTSDNTPSLGGAITGSLATGDTVVVYDGTTRLGTATVSGSTWSFTPTSALADGAHSFAVVVEGSGGNQGAKSAPYAPTIDTQGPSAPSVTLNDTALKTSDNATVTIAFAEAVNGFDNTDVTAPNGNLGTLTSADGGKTWTGLFTPTTGIESATNVITVANTYTDAAGNAGTGTTSANYAIDTLAPALSFNNLSGVLSDLILNIADSTGTVTVSGSSDAGALVVLSIGTNNVRTVTAGDNGSWSYTLNATDIKALGAGTGKSITATTTDAGGNSITASSQAFAIDMAAPLLTSFSLLDASDSGIKGDGKSNVTQPIVQFTAEQGVGLEIELINASGQSIGYQSIGQGTGSTQQFQIPANALTVDGLYTANLRATDAALNTTVRTGSYVLDTTAPSLTISSSTPTLKIGQTATITFEFTEAPQGFTAGDIVAQGGSLSGLAVNATNPKVYTATFTPSANFTDNARITVAAGGLYTDGAGNNGGAGATPAIAIDTARPTITSFSTSTNDGSYKAGSTIVITAAASEAVQAGSTFVATLNSGGTVSLTANSNGTEFIGAYQVQAGENAADLSVTSFTTGAVTDLAGNAMTGTTVPNGALNIELGHAIEIDTVAPTLNITSDKSALKAGETATLTFTFSEVPAGFADSGIITTNGKVSDLTASPTDAKVYTATFTPTADLASGSDTITVATGNYADAAGNLGISDPTPPSISIDTLAPTVSSVADNVNGTANAATSSVAYTYTFSEAVTGLTASDFTVSNGSIISVTGSGTTWTVNVTPATGVDSGTIGLTLTAGAVTDAAGNPNAVHVSSAQAIDTVAPANPMLSPADDGKSLGLVADLKLFFSETVAAGSGTITLYNSTSNTLIETFNVTDTQKVVISSAAGTPGSVVSINPTADLIKDQTYYVKADAGAFVDTAGNPWNGISNDTTWNFTGAGATVLIDAVAGDNRINLVESNSPVIVTGTLAAETAVLQAYTGAMMSAVLRPTSGDDITLTNLAYSYTSGTTATWSATLPAGSVSGTSNYTLIVKFTGAAGTAAHTIDGENSQSVMVDTEVFIPTLTLAQDSGAADSLTNNGTVNVTGLESGATWEYIVNDGNWTTHSGTSIPLTGDGVKSVQVRQTDVAGNVSTASTTLQFTLDTTPPAQPTVTLTQDTGISGDGVTSGASLTISPLATGDTRTYSVDGTASASYARPTTDGPHTVIVTDTDLAGNSSSGSISFTLDTEPPTQPTVSLTQDTGIPGDGVTSDASLTISPLATGDMRTYSVDGAGTSTSYAAPTFNGPHAVIVTDTDVAGNFISRVINFTLDTVKPNRGSITSITDNSGSPSDRLTNDNTPTLTVMAEAGVNLKVGQNAVETTTPYTVTESTQSPGTYTITFTGALADGGYGVRVVDKAGNLGDLPTAGDADTFRIDTATNVAITSSASTSQPRPTLSGTAEAGDTLTVSVGGATYATTADSSTGAWSVNLGTATPTGTLSLNTLGGTHTVAITATDAAGNSAEATQSLYINEAQYFAITTQPTQGQPMVMDVRNTADMQTLAQGSLVTLELHMDQGVTVTGTPMLQLVIGETGNYKTVLATLDTANSSGSTLVFSYQMQTGDVGQLAIGNLYLDSSSTIKGTNGSQLDAYLGIQNTGNVQASTQMYGTPLIHSGGTDSITGTAGNDMIALNKDATATASTLQAALGKVNGGAGDADVLVLQLQSVDGKLNGLPISDVGIEGMEGTFVSVGTTERTIKIVRENGIVNLYEKVDGTYQLGMGDVVGKGFERFALQFVDGSGNPWANQENNGMPIATRTFDSIIRNNQLTLGSAFSDTIDRSTAADTSKIQIIWPNDGNDTVTATNNTSLGDSIDVKGNDVVNAGAGNDFLAWWGAGTSTLNGGDGADTLLAFDSIAQIATGTLTTQVRADGVMHVLMGATEIGTIAKTTGGYTVTTTSQWNDNGAAATPNNMVANLTNVEQLTFNTMSGQYTIDLNSLVFTPDAAPTLTVMGNGPVVNGVVTLDFTFSEPVTGFDPSDITVTGGTSATSFTAINGNTYVLQITPTPSNTPSEFSVHVGAGAVVDSAGNPNADFGGLIGWALFGTSADNVLTPGAAQDFIYLGAGNDTIKLTAASVNGAGPDEVADFMSGDKIDLSALLGSGGSGYTSSTMGDTGAGFIEIKNLTLTKFTSTTRVEFDITLDSNSYNGNKISSAAIDLAYNYGAVTSATVTSPTYTYPDPDTGEPLTGTVWPLIVSNMSTSSGTGLITLAAFTDTANTPLWENGTNPITTANGKTLGVRLNIGSVVDTFSLGFEGAQIVTTSTAGDTSYAVETGISKIAGAVAGTTGTLEIFKDTGVLGTVGDNQLRMLATYTPGDDMTHLQIKYDTNSALGTTMPSSEINLDFDGDVTSLLTPAALQFI